MTRILAACPAYGGSVVLSYHRSFVAMMMECHRHGVELATMLTHSGFVSRARNCAAHAALKPAAGFTHLLTLDADMGWPPDLITRLLMADKDIIGAAYPARQPFDPPRFIGTPKNGSRAVNGIAPAAVIGCGFTLIKVPALRDIAAFHADRFCEDDTVPDGPVCDLFPSGRQPGWSHVVTDDVGFCRLAQAAGKEVFVDIASRLQHTGQMTFDPGPLSDFVLDKPAT